MPSKFMTELDRLSKIFDENVALQNSIETICPDPNKDPDIPTMVVMDLMDKILYSTGLRRSIMMDLGQGPDDEMRLKLLYLTHLVRKPEPEEIAEITQAIQLDIEEAEAEYDEDDEDDEDYDDDTEEN